MMIIPCRDERCKEAPCYNLRYGDKCRVITESMKPCPFYKAKSVRQEELKELRKRAGGKYYGV